MRVLLSIGCNDYESLDQLKGAEFDAARIFQALTNPVKGGYDPQRSRLLLSPQISEVRNAIAGILFDSSPIDSFSFFFAGHGCVKAESFYMCMSDSRLDALSVTALSLSDIFRSISEAAPAETNLIIDACQSGGLIADLSVLLKSELIGKAGTPGITLLATSALDQPAGETLCGGYGTNAILDCIEGSTFINDSAPMLDLIEIGRSVTKQIHRTDQNPVVWGLNISGPSRFCRNPCYLNDPARPMRELVQTWPQLDSDAQRINFEELWGLYSSINSEWQPRKFSNTISSTLNALSDSPKAIAVALDRMTLAMQIRAEESNDPFRSVEVCASLAVCLLPYIADPVVKESARKIIDTSLSAIKSASTQFLEDVGGEQYALLEIKGGGLSDLYFLPIKISKMLGWIACSAHIHRIFQLPSIEIDGIFKSTLQYIIDYYSGSIQAINDSQASYWALIITCASKIGLRNEVEQLTGLLFYSIVNCQGNLASRSIPNEQTLPYLLARNSKNFVDIQDFIARPNETLTVIMHAGVILNLEDIFDESLWMIDGLSFMSFLPADFLQFGEQVIEYGENLVWNIGQDVFRVSDFSQTWPKNSPMPGTSEEAALALFASLLFPDRVAWFCFDDVSALALTP